MRELKNPRQQHPGLLEMMIVRRKNGLLPQLSAAYQRGGMPAFQEVHLAALRQYWTYRTMWRLVDFASPISSLLTLASDLDRRIGGVGLSAAANAMIEILQLSWEKRLPREGAEILSTAPLLIYGNHPSMLTPFLIAAALNRSDLRIVALGYVGKLVPNLEPYLLPLLASQRRTLRGRSRSGMAHALSLSLIYHLDGQLNSNVARNQNQATLSKATEHILGGGAAMIFPGGGGKEPRGWFPGIGVIAAKLAQVAGSDTVYLAAVRISNSSNSRVYSLLSEKPLSRIRRRLLYRQPIQLTFEKPIPLVSLIKGRNHSPQYLASLLQNHHKSLFR